MDTEAQSPAAVVAALTDALGRDAQAAGFSLSLDFTPPTQHVIKRFSPEDEWLQLSIDGAAEAARNVYPMANLDLEVVNWIQDNLVESRHRSWPECQHEQPLFATKVNDVLWWNCGYTMEAACRIGEYTPTPP